MPRNVAASGESGVSLSQIAELAGVRPSAVSNWRRRFDDFPSPVSSAGANDLFALREVERWLEAHGRHDPGKQNERLLFEAADVLRSEAGSTRLVEILCAAISLSYVTRPRPAARESGLGKDRALKNLVESVEERDHQLRDLFSPLLEVAEVHGHRLLDLLGAFDKRGLPGTFEWVLGRRSRFVETRTSQFLADLVVGLGGSSAKTVFDPAAGEGGFLLAASRNAIPGVRLYGQEINESAWRIAQQRLLMHGLSATIVRGDSLANDQLPELRADVVYCDPPYGAVARWGEGVAADRRWAFGIPAGKTTDYAWIQHAIYHLTDAGRAYVLLPAGSLFRRGREANVRRELVRRGAVEAIVSLPSGVAQHTAVPLALWIVCHPPAPSPSPVLFVDASTDAARVEGSVDEKVKAEIIGAIAHFRRDGETKDGDYVRARAIPVLEILGTEANLLPPRWVYDSYSIDAGRRRLELEDAARRLTDARESLNAIEMTVAQALPSTRPSPKWLRIGELIADGLADVIRGARVPPGDCLPAGVRAVRTRDVREGVLDAEDTCFVDVASMSPQPELTHEGDIIVSPGSGKPIALVDPTGGHVLVHPVQGLRINGAWIDRRLAAEFIGSPRNQRFVAGTTYGYARLDLRDLELPLLMPEHARPLQEALEAVSATERLAKQMTESSKTAREALLDLASFTGDAASSQVGEEPNTASAPASRVVGR